MPNASALRLQLNPLVEAKLQAKSALQVAQSWPKEARLPVICLPLGMTEGLGGALLKDVLPGILNLQAELVILGKGSPEYGAFFTELAARERHRVHIVPNQSEAFEEMLLASDMALFLAEPSAEDVAACLAHGVIPVSPETKLLEDYNPVQESGTAFVYQTMNAWHCFAGLVRACETYKFPYDWKTIQRHGLEEHSN